MEGNFGGRKVWRIDSFRAFGERKFGELIDQPISTNLDGFSLANHIRFAKFTVSRHQSFPPYGIHKYHHVISHVINNELQHKFTLYVT